MAFLLSPGVHITERDLTNIIPAVSTSVGAFAGTFQWGPVMDPVRISSENELVQRFGRPNDGTFTSFFTAANFLAYSNNLLVVRTDTSGQRNAVTTPAGFISAITVIDGGSDYTAPVVNISEPNIPGGRQATAVATVVNGSITSITITDPGLGYTSATATITDPTGSDAILEVTVSNGGIKINNFNDYQTYYENGAGIVGEFAAKYPGSLGNSIRVSLADSATYASWAFKNEFDDAPGPDELHIIVIDNDGKITGVANSIIEKFAFLSKASNGRRNDGTATYYKHVINNSSNWIYWMDHPVGMNWGAPLGTTFTTLTAPIDVVLTGGADDFNVTNGALMEAFALFENDELYDISLVMAGKASATVASFIINNVVEKRKDCIAFISPEDVVTGEVITGIGSTPTNKILAYRNLLPSSSYAVLDTGYKYQYDRYNDVYRWVPLNGDIAGLVARTDFTDDPWFSPAGHNRGQIKNVVKLAFNPNKTDRDILYPKGVNPVVSFPGEGTVLYGDRTLLSKPSAFDRIGVRRLFIVLEKAIATAAKYQLFEFNDMFTRAQFRSMVEPFLRDVQGRRGIVDFRVVCDETNNTSEVIDSNRFVADIYIKPARSINYITLNFVATRSGVSFEEIVG